MCIHRVLHVIGEKSLIQYTVLTNILGSASEQETWMTKYLMSYYTA
jgi:hypothetical protein